MLCTTEFQGEWNRHNYFSPIAPLSVPLTWDLVLVGLAKAELGWCKFFGCGKREIIAMSLICLVFIFSFDHMIVSNPVNILLGLNFPFFQILSINKDCSHFKNKGTISKEK